MNTTLERLKKTQVTYESVKNTNDLVNGLFVTINSTSKNFDYADAYELLPKVQSAFYETLNTIPFNLTPKTTAPNADDVSELMFFGNFLSVYSIGGNRNGEKCHIHLWIYNLHSYSMNYHDFTSELKKRLKKLSGISAKNEFGIRLIPVEDPIDNELRNNLDEPQVIVDYVTKRNYGTLMNYFHSKNNKNFIYFY